MIWNDTDPVLSVAVNIRTQKICILANTSCKVDKCLKKKKNKSKKQQKSRLAKKHLDYLRCFNKTVTLVNSWYSAKAVDF